MQHRWRGASALLTLLLLELQRLADAEFQLAELALGSRVVASRLGLVGDHVLLAGTAPANRTAIGVFIVNWNATVDDTTGVAQRNAAIDLVAVLVRLDLHRRIVVFRAEALVAMLLRIHFLTFTIRLVFELACRQLVSFVI